ncbi:MAG: yfcG 3 [Rhizobiaceae bacterium]|jgi:glutathione S-transferase|nr:yfcG 3 [Rhizobiaceae bacterium]
MLRFYHAPWSRSSGILWLLEELAVSYELVTIDIRGSVPESYRDIQPNKKVPAVDVDGTIVTERAAICLYLGERFPEAGLVPAPGDSSRAAFLSALIYADSVFDPAVAARAQGWTYEPNNFSFGAFDDMVRHVDRLLSTRPYIAGGAFSAADTQFGSGIHYALDVLKVLPDRPVFRAYLQRLTERPAFQRFMARDLELAKAAGMAT